MKTTANNKVIENKHMFLKTRISIRNYSVCLVGNRVSVSASGGDEVPCIDAKEYATIYFESLAQIWEAKLVTTYSATEAIGQFDFNDRPTRDAFIKMLDSIDKLFLSSI